MTHLDHRGKDRAQFQTINTEPSKTIQSQAHLADIREIVGKYDAGFVRSQLEQADLRFLDITEFTDYADMMRQNANVEREFMALPAHVRRMFDHDVAKFLDAAHDPAKTKVLEDLGLVEAAPTPVLPDPTPAPPIPAPTPAAPLSE